jgi:rod shape-determining protein MreD
MSMLLQTPPDPSVGRTPPSTSSWIIFASYAVGLLLNTLPIPSSIAYFYPDFLLTALIFWAIFEPTASGILTAWSAGLFMDVIHGTLLSQHSLCYAFSTFIAVLLRRRLFRFAPFEQSLHIAPIVFIGQASVHWISHLRTNQSDFPFQFIIASLWVIPLWVGACYWIARWRQHTIHTLD